MNDKQIIDYIQTLKNYRLKFEPDWYRNFHAYENNTFLMWSRPQQTIVKVPFRKRFFTTLPEIKKQADSFENLLLSFMPLPVVYPDDISNEKDRAQAKGLSRLLKQTYLDWDAENLMHEYVHNAIKYPVSFFEINIENRYDKKSGKLKRVIVPAVSDAFDWLFDPRYDFEDNQCIIKVIRKTLGEIKEYKLFKTPTDQTAPTSANDFKELIYNDKYGYRTDSGDQQTVVVYQVFMKEKDGIRSIIIDGAGNRLDEQFYDGAIFYPVVPLQLSSGDTYQPSFVQNLIPIARSMALTHNRIEDFILKFVRGGYLVQDGSDVTFSDENGTIATYSGTKPDVLPTPQLSPAIFEWASSLIGTAERYGVNSIASGGTPKGSQMRAGKMMTAAVDNQRIQQKTSLDNLSQALKRVFEITIYYLSELTDEPTTFAYQDQSGDFSSDKFIGEKYSILDPTAFVIPPQVSKMNVEVEDVSQSMIKAKRDDFLAFAMEATKIPPAFMKTLLSLYSIGPTSDVFDEYQKGQTLLDSPEFQNLIAQARAGQLPPQESQALGTLLEFLSKTAPVPNPDQQGVQSKGGTPAPIGGQQPPMQPQQPQG